MTTTSGRTPSRRMARPCVFPVGDSSSTRSPSAIPRRGAAPRFSRTPKWPAPGRGGLVFVELDAPPLDPPLVEARPQLLADPLDPLLVRQLVAEPLGHHRP